MTITRRPPRPTAPTAAPLAPARRRKTAESFIEDAQHPAPNAEPPAPTPAPVAAPEPATEEHKPAKKKGKSKDKEKSKGKHKADKAEKTGKAKRGDKEAVLIRFEDDQLTEMDQRAAALGLSRAAWLRMVVSKALRGKKA